MAKSIATHYDFAKVGELRNALWHVLTTDPTSPAAGQFYYNSSTRKFMGYHGTDGWLELISSTQLSAHVSDATAAHAASAISYAGGTGMSATDVEAAIDELATEKANLASPTFTGTPTLPTGTIATTQSQGDNSTKIATTAYTDLAVANVQQGLDPKASVRVATTAAGTLATSFANGSTVDGVVLATGNRILIKDQAAGAENGIYTVNASGAPTRATDADASSEVTAGMYVWVTEGTANADSGWILTTNDTITLGTTALAFTQFSGAGQITAGNALTKTANTLDVAVDNSSIEISGDALRVKALGVTNAMIAAASIDLTAKVTGTLPVANGGTGGATAAAAKTSLGFMTRYAVTITGGSLTETITHNLGTRDVTVNVYDATTYDKVDCDIQMTSTSAIVLGFAIAPAAGKYRVVVIG